MQREANFYPADSGVLWGGDVPPGKLRGITPLEINYLLFIQSSPLNLKFYSIQSPNSKLCAPLLEMFTHDQNTDLAIEDNLKKN